MVSLNDVLLAMSNIPVDDPIAEIWGRGLQGGYKIIEYTGALPITINANGDVLLDYRIYGVSGGVGEPTENLFDLAKAEMNCYYDASGTKRNNNFHNTSDYIPVESGKTYTLSLTRVAFGFGIYLNLWDDGKQFVTNLFSLVNPDGSYSFSSPINGYIRFDWVPNCTHNVMLTKGSTAPPAYIPYGYKLPMTVSDGNTAQTVPVYIGENQLDSVEGVSDYVDKASGKIVQMIGEYTFTGDESFNKYGNSDVFYTSKTIDPVGITTVNTITMRCNHPAFTAIENKDTRYWLNPEADDVCCFLPGGMSQVFFRSTSNFTTAAECKAYLKSQYDNGTPVKISYWLKTPVEEDPPVPLPEIPTIKGETVIDYDGDPKPSQMYVEYKVKG